MEIEENGVNFEKQTHKKTSHLKKCEVFTFKLFLTIPYTPLFPLAHCVLLKNHWQVNIALLYRF
jgi:hypothetical protein